MRTLLMLTMLMMPLAAAASDALTTDPEKYKLVEENDRVRVLRYHDKPGDKTSMHQHPDFMLYAITPFKRRLTFPNGEKKEREFKAGDVILMPAQSHIGENTGTTETNVLIVELKEPATKPAPSSKKEPGDFKTVPSVKTP